MKALTITLVAVVILSMATVGAVNQNKASLGERVSVLEKRVATLEVMRWTPLAATNAVRWEVWNRISSCRTPKTVGPCTDLDPILYAFHGKNVPDPISHRLPRDGYWMAQPGTDGDSWQVTVTFTAEDGHTWGPFTWIVWSSNGLIWSADYYKAMGYGTR